MSDIEPPAYEPPAHRPGDQADVVREQVLKRLKKKRELEAHLVAYAAVNSFLVAIWLVTGANFFWPLFPMFGWGIALAFHAWDVYRGAPSEEQIQREIRRLTGE